MGERSDEDIAEIVGCTIDTVRHWRLRFGIRNRQRMGRKKTNVQFIPYRSGGIDWRDTQNRAMLGTMTDAEVARRLSCTTGLVGQARRRFGIAKYRKCISWDNIKVAEGESRNDVADRLGVSIARVNERLSHWGVTSNKPLRVCVCGKTFEAIREDHHHCCQNCGQIDRALTRTKPFYDALYFEMKQVFYVLSIFECAVNHLKKRSDPSWLVEKINFLCQVLGQRWESGKTVK